MQVVLNTDISGLGYKGEVVTVKGGYFRNFLLPRGMADVATVSALELVEKRKEKMLMEKEKLLANAKEVLADLKGLKIVIKAKASSKGKLYAGVTEEDVVKAVAAEKKVRLEKEFLKMDHFKEIGEFKVRIELGEGMAEEIDLVVEAE